MKGTDRDELEALREKLESRGFTARVIRPNGKPAFLRVVNMDAGQLAEDISVGVYGAEHCFLYSWGTVICPVRHVEAAADRLAHVLAPIAAADE
jgi:hypothetical protein